MIVCGRVGVKAPVHRYTGLKQHFNMAASVNQVFLALQEMVLPLVNYYYKCMVKMSEGWVKLGKKIKYAKENFKEKKKLTRSQCISMGKYL